MFETIFTLTIFKNSFQSRLLTSFNGNSSSFFRCCSVVLFIVEDPDRVTVRDYVSVPHKRRELRSEIHKLNP